MSDQLATPEDIAEGKVIAQKMLDKGYSRDKAFFMFGLAYGESGLMAESDETVDGELAIVIQIIDAVYKAAET